MGHYGERDGYWLATARALACVLKQTRDRLAQKRCPQRRREWRHRRQRLGLVGFAGETTDANLLNQAGVTTLIRNDGFKFWGNRTCSDDPLFLFETTPARRRYWPTLWSEAHAQAIDKPLLQRSSATSSPVSMPNSAS